MTHLYLSPHYDDTVLSCGGLVHQQTQNGERVVSLTICAGEPPANKLLDVLAQELHTRWGTTATNTIATRRAEDIEALRRVGAEVRYLTVPDCIYRLDDTDRCYYTSWDAVLGGPLHPAEAGLVERIGQDVEALAREIGATQLYAPLSIGGHVDHQLTRRVAENLRTRWAVQFYEDYPYAAKAERRPNAWGGLATGLTPVRYALSPHNVQAKLDGIRAYASQVGMFWKDEAEMQAAIFNFAQLTAGASGLAEQQWR